MTAVYITIEYQTFNCSLRNGGKYCKEYFDLNVHQSGKSTQPDPLTNNATYDKIARTAPSALGTRVSQTFSVNVKVKYIVLAFQDQGSCSVLFSVAVKYYFCPETVHVGGLVNLPRTIAPANNSVPVVSSCIKNAVHEQGILKVNCQSDGGWNISSLKGNCICKEDKENVGGECKGMYNYNNIEVQCWIILQAGNMIRQKDDWFFAREWNRVSRIKISKNQLKWLSNDSFIIFQILKVRFRWVFLILRKRLKVSSRYMWLKTIQCGVLVEY